MEIIKYQRLQGVDKIFSTGSKITCCSIETNYLVVGKESGEIHVLSFSGQHILKSKPHSTAVNCLSLFFDGVLSIASCSDDGSAVITTVNGEESKENTLYTCHEPITAICCESSVNTNKKERGFLLGTAKGRVIYRKTSWFAQKDIILFPGDGSPVFKIAWKADSSHVAWVDSSLVRIMDINSQTAICQLSPPYGIGVDDPYPCYLFWQTSNELLVGWGDSFRLLEIFSLPNTHSAPPVASNSTLDDGGESILYTKAARTIAEWQTDTIICGLFPFDEDHVVYLGYTPPIDQTISPVEDDSGVGEWIDYDSVAKEEVELIVAHRKTGEIVEADVLPAGRTSTNSIFVGPYHCHLLSTYQCTNGDGEYSQWSLHNYLRVRGGDRGHAPLLFVINGESPRLFLCRLSNVTDQITLALEKKQLLTALELSYHNLVTTTSNVTSSDSGSLTVLSHTAAKSTHASSSSSGFSKAVYCYEELFLLYVSELINLGQYEKVRDECVRLIPVTVLPARNVDSDLHKSSWISDNSNRANPTEILRRNEENVTGLVIWYRLIRNVMQYVTNGSSSPQRESETSRFNLLEILLRALPLSLTLATMKEKDESKGKDGPDSLLGPYGTGAKSLYDDVLYFLLSVEKITACSSNTKSGQLCYAFASHNLFVELIKKWSIISSVKAAPSVANRSNLSPLSAKRISPSNIVGGPEAGELFHHGNMVKTLNQLCYHHAVAGGVSGSSATASTLNSHSSSSGRWSSGGLHAAGPSNREEYVLKRNSMLLALAHLYSIQHAHKKSLTCYLDITIHAVASSSFSSILSSTTTITSARYTQVNIASSELHGTKANCHGNQSNSPDSMGDAAVSIMDSTEDDEKQKMVVYKSVFDLIEQDISLFPLIEQRIVNLLALSKTLTAKLLLNHVDKLPISSVANQLLLHDRRALLWYLQLLLLDGHPSILIPAKSSPKQLSISSVLAASGSSYTQETSVGKSGNSSCKSSDQSILHGMNLLFIFSASNGTAGDMYRINKQDYAEWHYKQLQLYVELIAQRNAANNQVSAKNSFANALSSPIKLPSGQVGNIYGSRPTPLTAVQSGLHCDFMQFLMAQLVSPDRCLQECERKMSLFFPEIIYLYGSLGQPRRALTLLLYETGDVGGAVRFLQEQYDLAGDSALMRNQSPSTMDTLDGKGSVVSSLGAGIESKRKEIIGLWDEITDYVVKYPQTLIQLLDELTLRVGHPAMQLHYAQFLPRIPTGVVLPGLQQRLQQLLSKHAEHEQLQRYCASLLQTDARTLLTRKKHFQHRAIRIDPTGGQCGPFSLNDDIFQPLKKPSINLQGQYATMVNWKCAYCTKPLLLPTDPMRCENIGMMGRLGEKVTLPVEKKNVTLWGSGSKNLSSQGCVIFNSKLCFHRTCYDSLPN